MIFSASAAAAQRLEVPRLAKFSTTIASFVRLA
jgi:hypothetical protein